jgi:hypothetical protein
MAVYKISADSDTFKKLCEYHYDNNLIYRDATDGTTKWMIVKEYVEKYNGRAIRDNTPYLEFDDVATYNWFLNRFQ